MTLVALNKHVTIFWYTPAQAAFTFPIAFLPVLTSTRPAVELQQDGARFESLSHSALLPIYTAAL